MGCGALKLLDKNHGEFKSIRVHDEFRNQRNGIKVISYLIEEAKKFNNSFFEETINIKGIYNRCVMFDASLFHAAQVFTGDPEEKERLIFVNAIFSISEKGKGFKSFLNVIEDARIEKKIKRKFAGARSHMIGGYRELMNEDFFGLRKMGIDGSMFAQMVI